MLSRPKSLTPPRLYINGFPKSGLHLAVRMALPMFTQASDETVWFGTNAWTTDRHNLEKVVDTLRTITPGTFLMGHTGYMDELYQLFDALHILMLFVYRDLRDVVVSQAHHILSDNPDLLHPGRHKYSKDLETVMLEVIQGVPGYPGIMERWRQYVQWFSSPFTHSVPFRALVKQPERCARDFFDWVYGVTIGDLHEDAFLRKDMRSEVIAWITHELKQRTGTTFRRGQTGSWKRSFTPRVTRAFKDADTDNELLRLGMVRKVDW